MNLSRFGVQDETDEHSLSSGSPAFSRPISLGTDGPNISRSSSPTRGFLDADGSLWDDNERLEIASAKLAKARPTMNQSGCTGTAEQRNR